MNTLDIVCSARECQGSTRTTMNADMIGECTVSVQYHHGAGSRREASNIARRYARERRARALFTGAHVTDTVHGESVVYRYALVAR